MLTAMQALEIRANIVDDLKRPDQVAYVKTIAERIWGLRNKGSAFNGARLQPWELHGWLIGAAAQADCFLIREEMNQHVMLAARRMPEEMTIEPEVMPSPIGMCIFEDSVKWTDVRGKTVTTKVIVWWQTTESGKQGYRLAQMTSVLDKDDYYTQKMAVMGGQDTPSEIMKRLGEYQLLNTHFMPFGAKPGPLVVDMEHARRQLDGPLEGDEKPSETTNPIRIWAALWMLMRQRFVASEPAHVSKSTARRMLRSGVPKDISVVGLRRQNGGKKTTGLKLDRDFHFPVDGHWRRKSAEDNPLDPASWFWVSGHLKGNLDGPLKATSKVKTFGRKT